MRKIGRCLWLIPRQFAVLLIDLYQQTLSPDHGVMRMFYPYGFCRHEPTCSEYARRMFASKGVLKGICFTAKRLLGCHPWTEASEERLRGIIGR
jgi:uncharacterized protein